MEAEISHEEIGRDIRFTLMDQDGAEAHYWNETFVLAFVLKGQVEVLSSDARILLAPEDVMAFDGFAPGSLQMSRDALLLRLHIDMGLLRSYSDVLAGKSIQLCSALDPSRSESYDEVRRYIARIFSLFNKQREGIRMAVYSEAIGLLCYLEDCFSVPARQNELDREDMKRLRRIIEYVADNYRERMTLEELALSENLSAGYFSRFFSKYMGMSVTQYLKLVRLRRAKTALYEGRSITAVALDSGFPNVNSFISAFRDQYGVTPGKFRRGDLPSQQEPADTLYPLGDDFLPLLKYAGASGAPTVKVPMRASKPLDVAIDIGEKPKSFHRSWRKLLTVGWAKELLLAPVQEQIRKCQSEIGFEYIRFHGILDDAMNVYKEIRGKPVYNFTYLDMLFDFIVSVGLKPYVEFSFTPSALARIDAMPFQGHSSVVSAPAEMGRWSALVTNVVRHWISRYGLAAVSSWRFSAVNGFFVFLGRYSISEFLDIYGSTYRAVKNQLPGADFGGPGFDIGTLHLRGNSEWSDFFDYCEGENCLPDFVSFQCFHADFRETGEDVSMASATHEMPPLSLSANENYLADASRGLRAWLKGRGLKHQRIQIDTWNSTNWQRDLCNDTCFKAAFLVKNILDNSHRLEAMGYWTVSDFMEELAMDQELYHGGYGLFTCNGVPKSGYNALRLLSRLDEALIARGEHWAVTTNGPQIHIAAHNYCHYDYLYLKHMSSGGDASDRYHVFVDKPDLRLRFRIIGLAEGEYEMETWSICREGGSSFDAWLRMGAPQQLTATSLDYLKNASAPVYHIFRAKTEEGCLSFSVDLVPHQVTTIAIVRV